MEPGMSLDGAQTEPRADPGQSQDGAKTMDFGSCRRGCMSNGRAISLALARKQLCSTISALRPWLLRSMPQDADCWLLLVAGCCWLLVCCVTSHALVPFGWAD